MGSHSGRFRAKRYLCFLEKIPHPLATAEETERRVRAENPVKAGTVSR